jgi:hypothetical protein
MIENLQVDLNPEDKDVKVIKKKHTGAHDQNNTVVLTPQWLLTWIETEFGVKFDFDPCVVNAE